MIKLPKDVVYILNKIKANSFKSYCVGGAIRDLLLGIKTNDFDFTTNATPDEIKKIFSNYFILTIGEKYGTITVQYHEKFYEITTFRKETIYEDFRHPKLVEFTDDLYTDLSRRDFTINAFAYNQEEGLIDYFNGQQDLKNKIIRCVGDPFVRLNEDALRILRAIRFAISLNFSIEEQTFLAMEQLKNNLQHVSVERFRNEFFKIILHLDYDNWHKYQHFFAAYIPELTAIKADEDTFKVFTKLDQDVFIRLAFLFNKYRIDIKQIMTTLKCSKKEIKTVLMISNYLSVKMMNDKVFIKRMIRKVPIDIFMKILHIKMTISHIIDDLESIIILKSIQKLLDEIIANSEPYLIKDLAITGHDLIKLGFEPGIKLHKMLKRCLGIVVENPQLNEKEYLLSYINDYLNNKQDN